MLIMSQIKHQIENLLCKVVDYDGYYKLLNSMQKTFFVWQMICESGYKFQFKILDLSEWDPQVCFGNYET